MCVYVCVLATVHQTATELPLSDEYSCKRKALSQTGPVGMKHCRWLTFWVSANSPSTRKLTDHFFPRVVKLFVPCRELPLTFEPSLLGCCCRPLGRRASPRYVR